VDPVLRWKPARVTVAVGLVGGALLALVAGYFLLFWLFSPVVFLGVVAAAVAAPVAAGAVWRGRWSTGSSGTAPQLAVAPVAFALAGCALLAALRAAEEGRMRDLGAPTESNASVWLMLLAAALVEPSTPARPAAALDVLTAIAAAAVTIMLYLAMDYLRGAASLPAAGAASPLPRTGEARPND